MRTPSVLAGLKCRPLVMMTKVMVPVVLRLVLLPEPLQVVKSVKTKNITVVPLLKMMGR